MRIMNGELPIVNEENPERIEGYKPN